MASAVETQLPSALLSSNPLDKSVARKNLSQATSYLNAPPSPPATESDNESESDQWRGISDVISQIRNQETKREDDAPSDGLMEPNTAPDNAGGNEQTRRTEQEDDQADARNQDTEQESEDVISPVTSPPYWTHNPGHTRVASSTSVESIPFGGITLRDNENSSLDERGSACWAKSVEITDHVTVNGSATNIGAFIVWNIRVETLSGSYMNIRKRYSEFDDFRWRLIRTFPNFEAAVPELPPKSIVSKFRPRFLEKRRAGLQYFLNCILLNPEFSGSPILKEFLFS
ncbi:Phox-like protein [Hypoxylon trugodes]|uniref:Phox-like protein n=1 Tax=Hypoxylon trugodes TaxID=326681 RepID=UPI00218DD3A6|nr:Phox-like protein [Hypoxylon trugodes]KAI1392739.1 Phox-like protein [Hypoxylon trugodes]